MLREEEAGTHLLPTVEALYRDPAERKRMQSAMRSAATPNAVKKAVEIILKTAKNKQKSHWFCLRKTALSMHLFQGRSAFLLTICEHLKKPLQIGKLSSIIKV